jgi:hypothetical protein
MSKEETKDLSRFLKPFSRDIQQTVLKLRAFVWQLYPQTNELIYDNYNAVAFGWSPTQKVGHTFCSIAVGRSSNNIHFGFYWGSKIKDPEQLLIGQGNQYRYLLVEDYEAFPKKYIIKLLADAYAYSLSIIKEKKEIIHGLTVTKSVSVKKREAKPRKSKSVKKISSAKKTPKNLKKKK